MKSKKYITGIVMLILALCMSLFSGCGTSTGTAATGSNGKKLKFAVIIHDCGSSFFSDMKNAAEDAGKQLGVEIKFMGPSKYDITQQVNMVESAIQAGYDGIAITAPEPKAFDKVVAEAKAKNIPIVVFNSDSPDCGRDAFVGQDLEMSGYQLGKIMFGTYMNGKGKYIITTCQPGMLALEQRISGIKRAQKEFPGIQLISTINITSDLTKAESAVENAYTAHKDVTAFLGVDCYAEGIGAFITTQKLEGKVLAGGFDLTPGTLKYLKSGAMQVSLGQNPYLQSYYAVQDLYLKKTKDINPIDINTGIETVTKENVDKYLAKQK